MTLLSLPRGRPHDSDVIVHSDSDVTAQSDSDVTAKKTILHDFNVIV